MGIKLVLPALLVLQLLFSSANSMTNCNVVFCDAGYTGGLCSVCAEGTYKPGAVDAACTACPPNSVSQPGSTSISFCQGNAGYSGADTDECVACVAGKYKEACIHAIVSLYLCTGTVAQTCTSCPGGQRAARP